MKHGACIINFDEYKLIGTHWIALYVNGDNVTYFDSFWVEYIQKENKNLIGNKNIATNIYKIQRYDSIICRYFCIIFIAFMIKSKILLFSPNEYENSDKRILEYFE